MSHRTVDDVIKTLPHPAGDLLPAPDYLPPEGGTGQTRTGLAVASMERHTTDEGWQLFAGLRDGGGYRLHGKGLSDSGVNVRRILEADRPGTVVIQDKREWDGRTAGPGFDAGERYAGVFLLKDRPDVFKVTVLKDAQRDQEFHRDAAVEAGVHAWVVYYHPRIVARLNPYVRPEHLVRTYHSVDPAAVPPYRNVRRAKAVLSGAVSDAYPLRKRLKAGAVRLQVDVVPHPGYRRTGCRTPEYLRLLSQYKVAVCTSSRYGYLLRKIVEATAAGCVVVTDLPVDDVVPGIDGNLVRVRGDEPLDVIRGIIDGAAKDYDPVLQEVYALSAVNFFDYRTQGRALAAKVEALRVRYTEGARA